jgi:signal transduction histidine kinase
MANKNAPTAPTSSGKRRATVLNVDDYSPGLYSRSKILKRAGFDVQEARSGEEALALLSHRPDVILLDVNLPDMSGLEVCRRIKSNPDTAGIVVLHISASNLLPDDQVIGLNSGADGYLTEPTDAAVLIATVNSLLRVRYAEERLRYINETLRSLTDMLSHELREPLRTVNVYAELLDLNLSPNLSVEQKELFEQLRSAGRRMEKLVEGVLSYSRAIYDPKPPVRISAQDALDASLSELQLLIRESGASVVCGVKLPLVQADQLSLVRIFSNLISNSIKYRGTEPLMVRISADPSDHLIEFHVQDNGIGIDPRYHAKIFDVFGRLHGAEYSGVGIGLSLCRRILESMGGSIWVDSAESHGATFHFTLPAA